MKFNFIKPIWQKIIVPLKKMDSCTGSYVTQSQTFDKLSFILIKTTNDHC